MRPCERFGETNQWEPYIYDGTHPVELPDDPNYRFLTDMTDQAVRWIKFQQALNPEKPFFTYFAPDAVHAPHHVPEFRLTSMQNKVVQNDCCNTTIPPTI